MYTILFPLFVHSYLLPGLKVVHHLFLTVALKGQTVDLHQWKSKNDDTNCSNGFSVDEKKMLMSV